MVPATILSFSLHSTQESIGQVKPLNSKCVVLNIDWPSTDDWSDSERMSNESLDAMLVCEQAKSHCELLGNYEIFMSICMKSGPVGNMLES
jgi:hypothetical protein